MNDLRFLHQLAYDVLSDAASLFKIIARSFAPQAISGGSNQRHQFVPPDTLQPIRKHCRYSHTVNFGNVWTCPQCQHNNEYPREHRYSIKDRLKRSNKSCARASKTGSLEAALLVEIDSRALLLCRGRCARPSRCSTRWWRWSKGNCLGLPW